MIRRKILNDNTFSLMQKVLLLYILENETVTPTMWDEFLPSRISIPFGFIGDFKGIAFDLNEKTSDVKNAADRLKKMEVIELEKIQGYTYFIKVNQVKIHANG